MSAEFEVAIEAAQSAGRVLSERLGSTFQVQYKGPSDLVTEMDRQAEDLIVNTLNRAFPSYGVVAEERGDLSKQDAPRWLIDPLDGTTNYAHGYPFFSVSIALQRDGKLDLGVVYDPMRDELFAAERGQGATLNGRPIAVSNTSSLEESLLASGFPYEVRSTDNDNSQYWRRFLKRTLSLRCDGSAALDLCYVAAGRTDGFWELSLGPWDVAAGALIVQEAGGSVTQVSGNFFDPFEGNVLATNNHIHAEMLSVLRT